MTRGHAPPVIAFGGVLRMDISRVAAQEKLFKRAVARSQSPAAFGSALSVKEPETRGRRLSFDEANEVKCHVS